MKAVPSKGDQLPVLPDPTALASHLGITERHVRRLVA
jgi:hypothetical protein